MVTVAAVVGKSGKSNDEGPATQSNGGRLDSESEELKLLFFLFLIVSVFFPS